MAKIEKEFKTKVEGVAFRCEIDKTSATNEKLIIRIGTLWSRINGRDTIKITITNTVSREQLQPYLIRWAQAYKKANGIH